MNNQTNYKTLAWVFGILALLFAILFFTKGPGEVKTSVDNAIAQIEECQTQISNWQIENKNSTSTESRDTLSEILKNCSDSIGTPNDR